MAKKRGQEELGQLIVTLRKDEKITFTVPKDFKGNRTIRCQMTAGSQRRATFCILADRQIKIERIALTDENS